MDKEELEKMRDELALNFSNHPALDYQDARAFKHGWNTVVDILWPEIERLKKCFDDMTVLHGIEVERYEKAYDKLTKANEEITELEEADKGASLYWEEELEKANDIAEWHINNGLELMDKLTIARGALEYYELYYRNKKADRMSDSMDISIHHKIAKEALEKIK